MQAYHPQNPTTVTPPPFSLVNYAAGDGDGDETSGVEFMKKFPPGYRFQPTDKEIILEYLMKKINNEALPSNMINTAELYASSPDDLSERFRASGDREWYFFTPRERKYKNSHLADRVAGGGYWKPISVYKHIMHNGKRIGSRRPLAYFRGKPRDSIKTDWLMQEYRVMNSSTTQENSMRLDDWVLCKVYKRRTNAGHRMIGDVVNEIGSSRKRNHNGEVNNNMADSEAIQLSVDSSIATASPSSSSVNDGLLANLYNPKGLGSASKPCNGWTQNTVGSLCNRNIYDEAINEEGNDNRASNAPKLLHVESSHQISTARSNAIHMLLLPSYRQQFPSFASESRYWRADYNSHLQVQQGHDQLNVECPYPLSSPSSSSSSHDASPLPLPNHHQQGSPFISESVNGKETYSDHFR